MLLTRADAFNLSWCCIGKVIYSYSLSLPLFISPSFYLSFNPSFSVSLSFTLFSLSLSLSHSFLSLSLYLSISLNLSSYFSLYLYIFLTYLTIKRLNIERSYNITQRVRLYILWPNSEFFFCILYSIEYEKNF